MKYIRKIVYPLTIIIVLIIVISYIVIKKNLEDNSEATILEDDLFINETLDEKEEERIINVDIKGAVKKPGVYKVNDSLVINDVIKLAGGLAKNADTSLINLSKKVTDEMVIIIYTKEEVKNSNIVDTVIKVVEKECICPNIENDGCLNTEIKDTIGETKLININTATIEELMTISGIGESKAKAIIEYRNKNKFEKIEDILNVSGIGNNLYEEIKIYITT